MAKGRRREPDWLGDHLRYRYGICIAMVGVGILSLVAGLVMIWVGLDCQQGAWIEMGDLRMTSNGLGSVVLVSGALWGYLAHRSRPIVRYRAPDGIEILALDERSNPAAPDQVL